MVSLLLAGGGAVLMAGLAEEAVAVVVLVINTSVGFPIWLPTYSLNPKPY